MLDILQPGLTETRGLLLYERASAKGLILQVGGNSNLYVDKVHFVLIESCFFEQVRQIVTLKFQQDLESKCTFLQKAMEDGLLSPAQFVAEMGKVVKDLEMTVVCLGMEMPGTYKRIVADKAAAAAITVKELCSYAEFL